MSETVLLIDDDQEFLDILAERLTIRGMEVTTAASGKTALDLVQNGLFNVIVLDLQMPEMDGLQVLEQLVANHSDQQIILLTGHATVARGVQAMKLGAADVLEKPVDIRELVDKIRTLADKKRDKTSARQAGFSALPQQKQGGVQGVFHALRDLFKSRR